MGMGLEMINGIIEKLDYLKALGVDAIWCSPVYDSPNRTTMAMIFATIEKLCGNSARWRILTACSAKSMRETCG